MCVRGRSLRNSERVRKTAHHICEANVVVLQCLADPLQPSRTSWPLECGYERGSLLTRLKGDTRRFFLAASNLCELIDSNLSERHAVPERLRERPDHIAQRHATEEGKLEWPDLTAPDREDYFVCGGQRPGIRIRQFMGRWQVFVDFEAESRVR